MSVFCRLERGMSYDLATAKPGRSTVLLPSIYQRKGGFTSGNVVPLVLLTPNLRLSAAPLPLPPKRVPQRGHAARLYDQAQRIADTLGDIADALKRLEGVRS